ncbi:MAG: cytidylate kinase-like family protein [Gemmatimonadaceae bacterium]|nr:cytidylate kinase-like family protein [Gemmatimonadaceae bacterium]NUO95214.1 cytidylate kinase-like family protein [Gemmatimonadaceae bacterium]NUP57702.1 cytidylate kinase-like family protein [Gemmatimonadaceae bacterium]NUP71719.1 cytidylate kinase-like family protein [Gemmatimonadaceae bacterium]NUR34475.1 cytidylate kinase-like family protein [Gemmatimonadaceae bacterium]
MAVITVSRQYGSGGSEVAERVARALGWKLYDNAVVEEVAQRLRMTPAEVSAREERVPSLVERMASAMALGAPEMMPVVGDLVAQPSEERMVMVTQRVIEDAVRAGPAVLVGRGAQCMLASRTDALHVYCYAPVEELVRYAVEVLDIPFHEAGRKVAEVNHHREQWVKHHFKRDWRDFANYDLCVNTARLGLDGSAELVTLLARERFGVTQVNEDL